MNKQNAGFTIIELMMVVVILAILGAVALPSFQGLLASNRLTSAANDMLAGVMMARSEAIKRGKRVVLCKSGNSSTCDNSLTWSSGWIVFVDDDNNATRANSEELLRVGSSIAAQITATADTDVANYISFAARGSARLTSGGSQSGNITFCIPGQSQRQIALIGSGRASVVRGGACA